LVNYIIFGDLKKDKIDEDIIERLSRGTLIMVDEKIVTKEQFKYLKSKYNFGIEKIKIDRNNRQFNGQVACNGQVKGKVRLILKRDDISKFKKDEILVSTMTVPDYLPAMKKAKAFITDEGGVTCHAAIISRELKIHCIIGTKIATKVLKDGDLVEVDANKGFVKKLKN